MSLNGIDKELILSILCRDQSQFTGTEEDSRDGQAAEVEVNFISGETTYQVMDALKVMGLDIHQIVNIISELWAIGNIDAAYLLLVLCYIVSEVELPEGAFPPLTATDLVLSCDEHEGFFYRPVSADRHICPHQLHLHPGYLLGTLPRICQERREHAWRYFA